MTGAVRIDALQRLDRLDHFSQQVMIEAALDDDPSSAGAFDGDARGLDHHRALARRPKPIYTINMRRPVAAA